MAADGHADTASGATKTPVVRLKGFGPKTPADPAPVTADTTDQISAEAASRDGTASVSERPATKPASTPPTPNFSVVRLKGFGPKTPPATTLPEASQPSAAASPADVATREPSVPAEPLAEKQTAEKQTAEKQTAEKQPAGESQSAPSVGSNPGVRLKGFSSQRPPESQASAPVDRSPDAAVGKNDVLTGKKDAPASDFSRSVPPGDLAAFHPSSDARFSPSAPRSSAPGLSAPPSSASAGYRSDTNIDRMTKRRWWKDTLYTKSGRRDADARELNQGQPQA